LKSFSNPSNNSNSSLKKHDDYEIIISNLTQMTRIICIKGLYQ